MKLYSVRGGNEADLLNRHYNLGVGISLGNKWFSPENIISLIEWSFLYTKDYVVVYVADSIHAINIEVRYRENTKKSIERAKKMGEDILKEVKELADKKFTSEQNQKIVYAMWEGLLTPSFREKVDFLYERYANDEAFKSAIIELIEDFTKRESRVFSSEDKQRLGMYIIEELPEILTRVPIDGHLFDAHIYPFDGKLPEFVEKIQEGSIFPDIKSKIIDTEPKVFLEVRE